MHGRIIVTLLLLAVLLPSPAAAQPELNSEPFRAGGRNNLLRYPDSLRDLVGPTIDSVDYAADVLLPLLDDRLQMPLQLIVDLLDRDRPPDSDEDVEADAVTARSAEIEGPLDALTLDEDLVCHIRIFARSVTPDVLPFTVAHEVAHCLQERLWVTAFYASPHTARAWWTEGSAEWLATLVRPDLAELALGTGVASDEISTLAEGQPALTDTVSGDDRYRGYGSVYFWLYLQERLGTPAVLDLLEGMPRDTDDGFQNHIHARVTDSVEVLHDYALALARGRWPGQPTPARLYRGLLDRMPPYADSLDLPDFATRFQSVRILPDPGYNAVRVSTTSVTAESGVRASLNTDEGTFAPLNDATPLLVCLEEDGVSVRLVLSRGDSDAPSTSVGIVYEYANDADGTCARPPDPLGVADCMVGTWQLTRDPIGRMAAFSGEGTIGASSSPGVTMVTFSADGTIRYTVTGFTLAMGDGQSGGMMTMDAALTGTIAVVPALDGTLRVTAFTMTIESLSAMANVNGFEMDMSDMVLAAGDVADSLAFTPATVECVGSRILDWWIVYEGRRYTWHFVRLSE